MRYGYIVAIVLLLSILVSCSSKEPDVYCVPQEEVCNEQHMCSTIHCVPKELATEDFIEQAKSYEMISGTCSMNIQGTELYNCVGELIRK